MTFTRKKGIFAVVGLLTAIISVFAGMSMQTIASSDVIGVAAPIYVGTPSMEIPPVKYQELINGLNDLDNIPWRYSAYYSQLGGTHKAFAFIPYTWDEAVYDAEHGDATAAYNYYTQSKGYWVWYTIPPTGITPNGTLLYGGAEKYPVLSAWLNIPAPSPLHTRGGVTVNRFFGVTQRVNCVVETELTETLYAAVGFNCITSASIYPRGSHIESIPLEFDDNFVPSDLMRMYASSFSSRLAYDPTHTTSFRVVSGVTTNIESANHSTNYFGQIVSPYLK